MSRYGALGDVQRLDLSSGRWSDLPPLKPVNRHHPHRHHQNHQHHQHNHPPLPHHYCLHHPHHHDDGDQVRAQHGCALVELMGESGMLVVGGDSGGTRLNDVRFVYKYKNASGGHIFFLSLRQRGQKVNDSTFVAKYCCMMSPNDTVSWQYVLNIRLIKILNMK